MYFYTVVYQGWDAVFHRQMNHREESWKYDAQRSIFDKLRGVSSGDETLCRMLDISSQTKSLLKEKLRMQKWAVFHLISKHSLNINFLCIFFMNYWWVWEDWYFLFRLIIYHDMWVLSYGEGGRDGEYGVSKGLTSYYMNSACSKHKIPQTASKLSHCSRGYRGGGGKSDRNQSAP